MSDFGRARRRQTQTCSLSTLPHPLATCASLPPNHHKWSANSSITSKNSSKKSTFSPCVLVVTHPRPPLDPPFQQWKQDANVREIKVIRRYHIQNREDYHKSVSPHAHSPPLIYPRYNKLCGALRSYAHRLSMLPPQDPFRAQMQGQLLAKLYDIGVLTSQAKLSDVDNKLTVAAFCRRRLAVFMCMSKMAETVSAVRTPLVLSSPTQPTITLGRKVHRTGSRPCRSRYNHRSRLSRHKARRFPSISPLPSHPSPGTWRILSLG